MNEFLPRFTPPAPPASAREPGVAPVRALSQAMAAGSESAADAPLPRAPQAPHVRERSAAAADYARIHAEIADVLAGLRQLPARSAGAVQEADRAIMALMPRPVVLLPQPPTDEKMVAFVAQVAQSMARQAAQARAAQAVGTPIIRQAAAH